MKEITTTDNFIGGSAQMDWANEGYGGKKKAKKTTTTTTKKKTTEKKKAATKKTATKKRTASKKGKKKGGAIQHISSSPVPGPKQVIANPTQDFTTEQRILGKRCFCLS